MPERGPDLEARDAWFSLASKLFNDPTLLDDAADHFDAPGGEDQDTADRMRAALRHAINLRVRGATYGL
jgi:hypothetical protein